MPVNLSVKNVPDDMAERLRERARRHHRSLQGELMAILEAAAVEPGRAQDASRSNPPPREQADGRDRFETLEEADEWLKERRSARPFTVEQLAEFVERLGIKTPDESTAWIREDRDAR